jgi:DNA modification methylase
LLAPDLDLSVTGFEIPEIDLIIQNHGVQSAPPEDIFTPDPALPPICKLGDHWRMNEHYLICEDAQNRSIVEQLMAGVVADCVFGDVPYNVPVNGHVGGKGRIKHREFAMGSGEMSDSEFLSFLKCVSQRAVEFSKPGSIHYICIDWRHIHTLLRAAEGQYELKNIAVWVKDNAGMGSFLRSQHEFICIFKKSGAQHQNNVQLGRFGRNRSNVWQYPGANSFGRSSEEGNLLALHPTVKPVQMVADAILDCTNRGDIVLDPFLGSGTTLISAERTGRRCYGVEIDPLYVDVAIRRWQRHTGGHAIHVASNIRFDDLAGER